MMMINERLNDHTKRIERLEHEMDEFVSTRNATRQLIKNWAIRLTDAMTNPSINWPEIHRVVDAMLEFSKEKEVKE